MQSCRGKVIAIKEVYSIKTLGKFNLKKLNTVIYLQDLKLTL